MEGNTQENQNFMGDNETVDKREGVLNSFIICYTTKVSTNNGIWQGENPLKEALPIFVMQLTLVIGLTRLLHLVLKPLRQPPFIAEVLAGMLLGPTVFGKVGNFSKWFLPFKSIKVLETIANLGLLYFVFLLGLEMDLTTISRTGKKALSIAVSGIFLPFSFGAGLFYFLLRESPDFRAWGLVYWGVTLTATSFPGLTVILSDLKLLHTDLGKTALSAAIVGDIFLWFIIAVILGFSNNGSTYSYISILLTTGFALCCTYAVRPGIKWVIKKIPEGESYNEFHVYLVLIGVVVCGLITDLFGLHSFTGAFLFGLIMPNGEIGVAVAEKLEDAVSGLLLPLFFLIIGLRANFDSLMLQTWKVVMIIVLTGVPKIMSTLIAAYYYDMGLREGMALGVLMNAKGVMALVILHLGRDQLVFDDETYATLLLSIVFMTALVTPLMDAIYKPSTRYVHHKTRTIQRSKQDTDLRILTCIHESRSVHGIINLLEISNPIPQSPIYVGVLHLVELTRRASAMLIIHNTRKSTSVTRDSTHNISRAQAEADNIINAFESYERESADVTVQPLTVLSLYDTMDEDICSLAEDKRVALIITPFHKQLTIDGKLSESNPGHRVINQNVLVKAPCSVGIFVDRGLGASPSIMESINSTCHICMIFITGRDDREALSYAWRMAGHPGVILDVVRYIPGPDALDVEPMDLPGDSEGILSVISDYEREKQYDDTYINEFRVKTMTDDSIRYTEQMVNSGEETIGMIREKHQDYNLYIVGRGQGVISPLTARLSDWSDNPELGAIGDILVSSEFANSVSVLVVQQYAGAGLSGLQENSSESSPETCSDGVQPFVHHSV